MSDHCAAIVLAAGASRRLGQPKQLLKLDDETLLHRTIRIAQEAGCDPIFVVLGFEPDRMQQELRTLHVRVVINPDWQSGMGSSLHFGIKALLTETSKPQKVLLLLCDQIKLSTELLLGLLRKSSKSNCLIVASSYSGKLGAPAIFREQLYPELLKVEGDQGARAVIQQYRQQTIAVDFIGGAIDIDTPQDLSALTATSLD
jgi:molybdenum cofactor cytidylyltransferase